MCDERGEDVIVYLINDTNENVAVNYKITGIYGGEEAASGMATAEKRSAKEVITFRKGDRKVFYLIEWEIDGKRYTNHFHTELIDISLDQYLSALKKCGYDNFEGFEND